MSNTCCVTGGCQTCQSACQLGSQTPYSSFQYSVVPAKDVIISPQKGHFSRDVWNEGIERINNVLSQFDLPEGDRGQLSKATGTHMTAAEFNKVANKVGANSVSPGDLIEAKLFTALANKIAAFKYLENQCDSCNAGCDTCNYSETYNCGCDTGCNCSDEGEGDDD